MRLVKPERDEVFLFESETELMRAGSVLTTSEICVDLFKQINALQLW